MQQQAFAVSYSATGYSFGFRVLHELMRLETEPVYCFPSLHRRTRSRPQEGFADSGRAAGVSQ